MAGYSYVGQVTDPASQKALKTAFDLIGTLRADLDRLLASALTNASSVNVNGQRVVAVADPQANGDAVNAGYMRASIAAQLGAFKGSPGVSGTIDTATTQVVTVVDGIIVEIA